MKKIMLLIIVCLVLAVGAGCSDKESGTAETQNAPVVSTSSGTIKGTSVDGVVTFKGVPFAQPPVKDLRYTPPKPVKPWEDTLDCTEFKPSAPQVAKEDLTTSEDCLYLNIWAPENAVDRKQKENLPVLVFIHGGAYASGSASDAKFDGTAYAKDGVICITVSYRLNALGFLTSKEIEKESGYMGNLGVLDQIQSLKWINENIERFGGDSNKITISGESAGSMSASNLIFSPLAKGLFHQAIMESGALFSQPIVSAEGPGDAKQSLSMSKEFMKKVGAKSLDDLRKTELNTLVDNSAFSMDMTQPNNFYFMPVFDGKVIDSSPYKSLKEGNYNDVKVLMGYNSDEGTMFIPDGISEEKYQSFAKRIFGKDADKFLKQYPVDSTHSATDRARQLVKASFQIACSIFGDAMGQQNKDIYVYNFDYHIPALDKEGLGVMHGLELFFTFDTFPETLELPEGGQAVIDQVHNSFVSFIKTGDPNNDPDSPSWPKYTPSKKQMLQINENSKAIPLEDQEYLAFITDLLWEK